MPRVTELKTASVKEIVRRNNKLIIDRIVGNDAVKLNFHLDLSEAYEEPINLPSYQVEKLTNQ